jgi:DNA-binding response OmpR family regulator
MAIVLVVDDERLICDLLRAVLSRHGHEVLTATSGREGLELFRQRRPRFTLVDLHMPEMDGIEVLKQIRAMDPQASVIVLTGGGADILEKENQARELGVTDFLKKGLSLDVLVKAMERAMQLPAKAAEPPPPSEEITRTPSVAQAAESIMIVDDEPLVRDLLTQFLTMRGYRVRAAQDGPAALGLVEQERPKLIVLDMYMPGMNGLEVLRALRAKKYAGGVIALTGSQDEKLLQEVLDLGAVDVMGKPVDLERLALAVQVGCILTES